MAQAWLPRSALEGERAAAPFVSAVRDWTSTWFLGPGWRPAGAFSPAEAGEWSVLREDGMTSLLARPGALLDLAFAILGHQPRGDLTDADKRLLRRLASRALDDLHARIVALFPDGLRKLAHARGGARLALGIGSQMDEGLAITVDSASLAALTRAAYAPSGTPARLSSRREAVMGETVRIEAMLGRASLAIQQIDTLEPGDIVMLDTSAGGSVQLVIDGTPSTIAFALGESADRVTLTLQD